MIKTEQKLYQLLSICLLGLSSSTYAAAEVTAYVDTVNGWGAWELGIEPAAGGPAPTSNRALTARDANIKFRPNDNSAYTTVAGARTQTATNPSPLPPPAPIPGILSSGTVGSGQPLPTGDPSSRWR